MARLRQQAVERDSEGVMSEALAIGRPKVGRPFAFSAPLTNGPPASAGNGAR